MSGFRPKKTLDGGTFIDRKSSGTMFSNLGTAGGQIDGVPLAGGLVLGPSLTAKKGDALAYDQTSNAATNRLIFCAATSVADFILDADITSDDGTTGNIFFPQCIRAQGMIFETDLVLLKDSVAISADGTATTCKVVMSAGSAHDLQGGIVYNQKTGDVRRIHDNSYSGGNVIITVLEPWSQSDTALVAGGGLISINAFAAGDKALNFGGARVQAAVLNTIAGRTSGKIVCVEVDIKRKLGQFYFLAA
jgi:hypothetical protein